MLNYLLRRLLNGLLVLFGVVTVVFFIFNIKPGDPARMLADQRSSPEALAAIRKDLGLELPLMTRYGLYLNGVSPLALMQRTDPDAMAFMDRSRYRIGGAVGLGPRWSVVLKAPYLRFSYQSRRGVAEILGAAFPNTAILAVLSMLLAVVVGVAMGVWAALRKGTWVDSALLAVSALGMAGPSFFVAVLVAWLGGYVWFERIPVPILPVLALLLWIVLRSAARRWWAGDRYGPARVWPVAVPLAVCALWLAGHVGNWAWATAGFARPGTGLPMSGYPADVGP